jgi:hypothetical protein
MGRIEVDSSDVPLWLISTNDSNQVPPPVNFGAEPGGMRTVVSPQPLTLGRSYTVAVWRWVSGDTHSALFFRAGTASFLQ